MKLDALTAIIPQEKTKDYLLSPSHPIGRYKAAFFASLGYSQDSWQGLEAALKSILSAEAEPLTGSEYGQKFAVRGNLTGPNGRSARVVTIWIILGGEIAPRFITAYPEE